MSCTATGTPGAQSRGRRGQQQERREPAQHLDQAFLSVSKASRNKGGQLSISVSQSEGIAD
jgi:hypothetical protein